MPLRHLHSFGSTSTHRCTHEVRWQLRYQSMPSTLRRASCCFCNGHGQANWPQTSENPVPASHLATGTLEFYLYYQCLDTHGFYGSELGSFYPLGYLPRHRTSLLRQLLFFCNDWLSQVSKKSTLASTEVILNSIPGLAQMEVTSLPTSGRHQWVTGGFAAENCPILFK